MTIEDCKVLNAGVAVEIKAFHSRWCGGCYGLTAENGGDTKKHVDLIKHIVI